MPLHEATGSISTHPGWDATPSQVYPKYSICQDPFIHLSRERDHYGSKVSSQAYSGTLSRREIVRVNAR